MSTLPLISIITPVFNGEKFIKACLESVISQNYPFIEHIVVDGLSTDNTVSIVESLRRDYNHIILISENDRGQSDAMNKGIREAKGEYVGILNADDFYEPNVLLRVGNLIQTLSEPHLLVANCNIMNNRGEIVHVNRPRHLEIEKLLMGPHLYEFPLNPSAYFYPRDLHKVTGFYDVSDHYGMDVRFILSAVQHIKTLYIDEVWGNWRFIEGTKTFEDVQIGGNRSRIRKIFWEAFLKTPIQIKIRVGPRWILNRLVGRVRILHKAVVSWAQKCFGTVRQAR
jgi:glycosyltransferase involved in cell wall biosynthesis